MRLCRQAPVWSPTDESGRRRPHLTGRGHRDQCLVDLAVFPFPESVLPHGRPAERTFPAHGRPTAHRRGRNLHRPHGFRHPDTHGLFPARPLGLDRRQPTPGRGYLLPRRPRRGPGPLPPRRPPRRRYPPAGGGDLLVRYRVAGNLPGAAARPVLVADPRICRMDDQ